VRKDQGVQAVSHQQWLRDKLFDLASEVQEGCIVELGTFHGTGTIVLARGARAGYGAPVYTIDDYVNKQGWIGEPYRAEDKQIFRDRIKMARVEVTLIQKEVHEAALGWHEPIGMLYWDTGGKDRFWLDWLDWNKHIVSGGVAVIKDISTGDLGATERIQEICSAGLFVEEEHEGGVTILRRV
jgi:hypothetical protein